MKDENYINIQGWMVNRLNLKGNELLIYAIIYGFSQLEGNRYTGSLSYLCKWTNSTRQGVSKSLNSLLEKGFINKYETFKNNIKFNEYEISDISLTIKNEVSISDNEEIYNTENNSEIEESYIETKFTTGKQSLQGYATKFTRGSKQSLHNNIYNNINIDDEDYINKIYNNLNLNFSQDQLKVLSEYAKFQFDLFKTVINDLYKNGNIEILNNLTIDFLNKTFEKMKDKEIDNPIKYFKTILINQFNFGGGLEYGA